MLGVRSQASPAARAGVILLVCGLLAPGVSLFAQQLGAPAFPPESRGAAYPPNQEPYREGAASPRSNTPPQLVAGVRVIGNEAINEEKVRSYLKTRKDREFDPEVVQADVRALASSGLFRDVRTYTQQTPQGVVVTYHVFERPTIQYVKILGNRAVTDKSLLKKIELKEGDALNTYSVEMARQKIEEFYHSKGYRTTEVSIVEGNRAGDHGVVLLVNEGNLERVWDVRFVGNTIASDARLETLIQSRPGYFKYLFRGRVDYAKIDEDVDRLTAYYRSLGFFQAKVGRDLDLSESSLGTWLTVSFIIHEGPRAVVRNVSIAGNQQYSSEELLAEAGLKPGQYFNLGLMNRDLARLRDYYGGRGYIFADIQADPRVWEDAGQMDLVYTVEEGSVYRVGRINVHIDGEYSHTRNNVVLNRISLQPGDIIDIREVRDSERRLKSSQLFLNEPTRGIAPKIVVRPPELKDLESLARQGGEDSRTTRYRGQSPDPPERIIDLNVFVSPP